MDKLNFIDSLDEEQSENAVKVARMAREAGVDPNLAVAIAYKEGGLRTNAPRGSSGEIGMMQVMPKTGKDLGYDEKKLSIPNQNIKAGIEYLKLGLQATENDPQLAAIFYNGGPGAVDALKSGKDPDPRVFDYVKSLNSYGAFESGEASSAEAESGDMVPGAAPPPKPPAPDTSGASRAEQFLFGGIGAGTGAVVSAGQGISNARTGIAATRAGAEETARIAAQRAAVPGAAPSALSAAPAAPAAPAGAPGASARLPIPSGGPDAGRMAPGQTGTMPYNYGKAAGLTDIEAGRALDMTKQEGGVHDLSSQRREGLNKVKQLFPGESYVENPRFGGIMTPEPSVGAGPRAYTPPSIQAQAAQSSGALPIKGPAVPQIGAAKPPPIPTVPPMPKGPSGLDAVTNMFKGMMRPLKPVVNAARIAGRYGFPPLAGIAAGLEAADVAHEFDKQPEQRDYTKMGLQGATAVGGVMSMFPPTMPLGIPLATGAGLTQAYREDPEMIKRMIERLTRKTGDIPLLDEMTGPLP